MLRLYRVYDAKTDVYDVRLNDIKAELMSARVSAVPYGCHWPGRQRPESQTELAPFVRAQADERVDVRVRAGAGVKRAVVRPASAGVRAEITGGEARFTLPGAGAYVLEMGPERPPLTLIIAPPDEYEARGDVIRFGPGVHAPGRVKLKSNQTVYIDAEAVVYASFVGVNVENVRITGHGVINASHEARTDATPVWQDEEAPGNDICLSALEGGMLLGGARFIGCKGVEISGVTIMDSAADAVICAACERVNISGVNIIGQWKYDARGISIVNCSDARVEGGFVRAFGDCVSVKGLSPFEELACERVRVSGMVIWCDWGCALGIGPRTRATRIRDIVFENCDLIRGAHVFLDVRSRDDAEISRVDFKGMRVEYVSGNRVPYYQTDMLTAYRASRLGEVAALLSVSIYEDHNQRADAAHGEILDISLCDASVIIDDGAPNPEIRFAGLDSAHMIKNCRIKRLAINGARAKMADANIMVNAFVSKIAFV